MNFFTDDLIYSPNLFDEDYKKKWKSVLKQYWSYFEKIKNNFPVSFVNPYIKHAFHDHSIEKIELKKRRLQSEIKLNILIYLDYEGQSSCIEYVDVKKYKIKHESKMGFSDCDWLYSEISLISDHLFSHEIILAGKGQIYIEFKKIKYSKSR